MHLMDLIDRLPEGYRSVLMLKYDNGFSTGEIASMLNLSEENVKSGFSAQKRNWSRSS